MLILIEKKSNVRVEPENFNKQESNVCLLGPILNGFNEIATQLIIFRQVCYGSNFRLFQEKSTRMVIK